MLPLYISTRQLGATKDFLKFVEAPHFHHFYFPAAPKKLQWQLRTLGAVDPSLVPLVGEYLTAPYDSEEDGVADADYTLVPTGEPYLFVRASRGEGDCVTGEDLHYAFARFGCVESMPLHPPAVEGDAPELYGTDGMNPSVHRASQPTAGQEPSMAQSEGAEGPANDISGDTEGATFVIGTPQQNNDVDDDVEEPEVNLADLVGGAEEEAEEPAVYEYVVEVDTPESAREAIEELEQHPWVRFVAFHSKEGRNLFSASSLPVELVEQLARLQNKEDEDMDVLQEGTTMDDVPDAFVPDLVVDNLALWVTEQQLREFFAEHGKVASVRFSLNDRTGTHNGCAAIRMQSFAGALRAQDALNGLEIAGQNVAVGYVDPTLTMRHLLTDERIAVVGPQIEGHAVTAKTMFHQDAGGIRSAKIARRDGGANTASAAIAAAEAERLVLPSAGPRGRSFGSAVVCHYCRQPGHTMHDCVVRSREMALQDW